MCRFVCELAGDLFAWRFPCMAERRRVSGRDQRIMYVRREWSRDGISCRYKVAEGRAHKSIRQTDR